MDHRDGLGIARTVLKLGIALAAGLVVAACGGSSEDTAIDASGRSSASTTATLGATSTAADDMAEGSETPGTEPAVVSRLLPDDCPSLNAAIETLDMLIWGILDPVVEYLPDGDRTWIALSNRLGEVADRSPPGIGGHLTVISSHLERVAEFYEGVDVSDPRALYEIEEGIRATHVWMMRLTDEYSSSFEAMSSWAQDGCAAEVDRPDVAVSSAVVVAQLEGSSFTGFGMQIGFFSVDDVGVVRSMVRSSEGGLGFVEFRDDQVLLTPTASKSVTGGWLDTTTSTIAATSDGSVWITAEGEAGTDVGGTAGLARWDGSGWRFVALPPEVWGCDPTNERCDLFLDLIAVDSDDGLWIAGSYTYVDNARDVAVVVRFDGRDWVDYSSGVPGFITAIEVTDNGTVWILNTENEVAALRGATWDLHDLPVSVNALTPLDGDAVAVGGSDYAAVIEGGIASQLPAGDDPYGPAVEELFPDYSPDTDEIEYQVRSIVGTPRGIAAFIVAVRFASPSEGQPTRQAGSEAFVSIHGPDGWQVVRTIPVPDRVWPPLAATADHIFLAATDGTVERIPIP